MKILKTLMFFLCQGIFVVYGQQLSIKPLKVGQQVPDLQFDRVVNAKYQQAKLSDYKGKLVILYFWSLSCAPCIRNLPKYDEFQKKFSDRLQFIPVTFEKTSDIKALLEKKWPGKSKLTLPFVVNDTSLRKYFPYSSIPHPVWIDAQRKVVAIGDPLFLTEEKIAKAIQGIIPKIELREEAPSPNLDIFKDRSINLDSSSVFRSYLAKGRRDLGSATMGLGYDRIDPSKFYIKSYGYSLVHLYRLALDASMLPKNKIVYEGIKDMAPYLVYPKFDDPMKSFNWMKNNLYIYHLEFEIDAPSSTQAERNKRKAALKDKARHFMLEELNRYFGFKYGLTVTKETRPIKCMIVTRSGKDDSKYRSSKSAKPEIGYQGDQEVFNNVLMSKVVGSITARTTVPIVDETGYKDPVDLRIPIAALKDMDQLKKALRSYGLDLREAEREMEVLVFKEDPSKKGI